MILCVVVVCLPFFVVVWGFLYATTQDEMGKYFHYVSHFFLQLQQWTCLGKKLLSSKPLWIMWNKQAEWHFELLLCCFWSTAIFLTCLEWLGMWLWKKSNYLVSEKPILWFFTLDFTTHSLELQNAKVTILKHWQNFFDNSFVSTVLMLHMKSKSS